MVKRRRGTTCPCPRRRRESEVLVGCFVASVSEVSLAFCCVERLKQSQSGTGDNSQKLSAERTASLVQHLLWSGTFPTESFSHILTAFINNSP